VNRQQLAVVVWPLGLDLGRDDRPVLLPLFYVQQPDLNWRNPEVHKAMDGVLDFWMKHGVAGFRIDAVSRLYEDPELRETTPTCRGPMPTATGISSTRTPTISQKYMTC